MMAFILYAQINNNRTSGAKIAMKSLKTLIQTGILLGISSAALSNECGEIPANPGVVDGASVSMQQLVENSQEVKAYIAAADAYLDCNAAFMNTIAYKDLDTAGKNAVKAEAQALLETRNSIGDDFNAQVMAYQEANPE